MGARKRQQQSHAKRKPAPPALPAASTRNADQLRARLRWLLPDESILAGPQRHGNTSWRPLALVMLALGWAWAENRCVTDAFAVAAAQCQTLGLPSLGTYQGFMHALARWTAPWLPLLWSVLQQRMAEIGGAYWRIDGWVPIAFDGSRSTAPRTRSAEKAFCAPRYGQGKTARYRRKKSQGLRRKRNAQHKIQPQAPQVWITLLWHMGLRLPWMWRLGPSNSSERAHVQDMLAAGPFPERTLFCGDAGFVGSPLWSQILTRGGQFLVRVGANVSLLTELHCTQIHDGLVLCWPQAAQAAGRPPLRLRLVRVKLGKTKVWMLTSVLEPARLSRTQIIQFYRMRWGIEVEFRGLKQTLDRAELRCRDEGRLLVELHWSLLALAVAELFALQEQLAPPRTGSGPRRPPPPGDPRKRSLANTLRALRFCLRHLSARPLQGRDLATRLRQATTDDYQRTSSKRARYRPENPDKKPLGDPHLRRLTPHEQRTLKSFPTQKTTT